MVNVIDKNLVVLDLDAKSKEEVFSRLADVLDKDGRLNDKEEYIENVKAREATATTGIGFGIAIPHGKTDAVKDVSVVIGRLKQPVDWNSMDGKPVKMIFQIAVPESSKGDDHLRLLSELSRKLIHEEFREAMFQANSVNEVLNLLGNSLEKKETVEDF
jgi:fructose-specific phosphotransferase system IIA component